MSKLPQKNRHIGWEYVAGFFDGEGCVSIVKQNGKLKRIDVGLFQSEPQAEVLRRIEKFLAREGIVGRWKYHSTHRSENASTTVHLVINRQESVRRFLEAVYPYLIVKSEKSAIALGLLYEKERRGVPLTQVVFA